MRLLLPLLVLSGCSLFAGKEEDTEEPGLLDDHDVDADGYKYEEDCNDDDASVHPDAPEVCDAADVDENCNGLADNADPDVVGGIVLYHDADGDGYGALDDQLVACELTTGYSLIAGDCDDGDPGVSPVAVESCDEGNVDEDCNGLANDDDPNTDPATQNEVYIDRDRDGYGDFRVTDLACAVPAGWSRNDLDCADGSAAVNPDGIEICDEVDNDCDGLADDAEATDATTWYADDDGDAYGDADDTRLACAQPEGFVAEATDCDDLHYGIHPGARETCDDADEDCDTLVDEGDEAVDATTWYADGDADGFGDPSLTLRECGQPLGYLADATDCDDTDAAINPAATEVCDSANTDEDCDGLPEDSDSSVSSTGTTTFYADADGDTYGDADTTTRACDLPSGYVTDTSDCDDDDASISPAATEVCDSGNDDEDCDGTAEDRDSSVDATTKSTFYADDDGDGYGDASSTTAACDRPSGYVTGSTDCDDSTSRRSPANTEVCDSADMDEDCDGLADDDDSSTATSGMTTFYTDADGDGYGATSSTISRCDQPSGYGTTGGDCDDIDAGINPGAAEVCLNVADEDCDGSTDCSISIDEADRELKGEHYNSWTGQAVDGAGDFNNDGYDDVIIGAPHGSRGSTYIGDAYLVTGGASGDLSLGSAGGYIAGDGTEELLGWSVAGIGDMDHDGYDDVVVGVPYDGTSGYNAGKIVYVRGSALGTLTALSAAGTLTGVSASDEAGLTVSAAGDVNRDGYVDFLVGAPARSSSAGAVYLITNRPSGSASLSTATAILTGESSGDEAGHSLADAGDVNADGYDDFLVGAPNDDDGGTNAGAVYLILGPETGTRSLSGADAKLRGPGGSGGAGQSVAGAGDVNGDGYDDVLTGTDYGSTGTVYLKHGPFTGSSSLSSANASITGVVYRIGDAVDGGGDLDGDGYEDILIGCESYNATVGSTYVMRGPLSGSLTVASADVTIVGEASGDRAGYDLAYIGDHDGDGLSDFVVGSPYNDDGTTDGGAAWVFLAAGF